MSPILLLACTSSPSVTVLAASSLTEVFGQLEQAFEAQHGLEVQLSVAGSQTLATQLRAGLDAQVFASANQGLIEDLAAEGRVASPEPLVRGRLVLAVAADSVIQDLRDLDRAERLVLGVPEVPVGAYSERLLEAAGQRYGSDWLERVRGRVVSRELSVRQVRTKLLLGEADAALVYATDMNDLKELRAIELPMGLPDSALYYQAEVLPIRPEARAWTDFTRSDEGLEIVRDFGLEAP